MAKRPSIAITKPTKGNRLSWICIRLSVWLANGKSFVMTPNNYKQRIEQMQGLIISGGTDIHPARYGHNPKQDYSYDLERDEMEFALLDYAMKNNLPVLGICRGAQLINIAHGGTLHLNIALAYEKAEYPNGTLARIFFRKPMQTVVGTLLHKLVKCDDCTVNSMHTQSVDKLGDGLVISSQEPNGVVQAIEHPEKEYLLGVQFHPEYLQHRPQDRRIFKALIEASRE